MLKLKIGAIGITLTLVVLAAWVYLFDPTRGRSESDDSVVTLLVTFEPPQRKSPIVILVRRDGRLLFQDTTRDSPWQEPVTTYPGSQIQLMAIQPVTGPVLQCSITVRKHTTGPVNAVPGDNGSSNCMTMAMA